MQQKTNQVRKVAAKNKTLKKDPADEIYTWHLFLYCLFWIKEENELENGAHFSGFVYVCVFVGSEQL